MRFRTNLIVEDRVLEVLEEPEHVFAFFIATSKLGQLWLLRQQPQLSFNTLELTRRKSARGVKEGSLHTVSILPDVAAPPRQLDASRNVLPVQLFARGCFESCSLQRQIPGDVFVKSES